MRATAKEMYNIASRLIMPDLEKEYDSIIKIIETAAKEGRFSCQIKNMHSLNAQQLENNGFTVRLINREFSPYFYLIEWYSPKDNPAVN